LDQLLSPGDEKGTSGDLPFGDISGQEILLESEEDYLKGEGLLIDEDRFFDLERLVPEELAAIQSWVDELEKQRTSTIEKNMMEIFREFKKGVDEKIGREDYDTRYNLGIAYKEMGLIEEAIHEFLISAKHPLKVFDSAGLLGICFRDKGMLDEAINWFEKALGTPDRKEEEYKAVKYELVLTARLKEDFPYAMKLASDILKQDPTYRNIREISDEMKAR
ncbi:MAG TPA: tetratricopeptide repeat protein, partial [Candidatus Aminicenantes bacterium]|nr:tetratricopeptide repeat protein [Candidatus Aminicenantes bacterium]